MFVLLINNNLQAQKQNKPVRTGKLVLDTTKRKPILHDIKNETNVAWTKKAYSLLNFNDNRNKILIGPDSYDKGEEGFAQIIFNGLKEGVITAYYDDNFVEPHTYEMLSQKSPSKEEDTLVLKLEEIDQLKIKEEWFLDKNYNVLDVRIVGICPIVKLYDRAGKYVKREEMFWLDFSELHYLLVHYNNISKYNPKDIITLDDYFNNRLFSSTMVKDSIVNDLKVTDYNTKKEVSLEKDQIKRINDNITQYLKDY